ncbi:hypothetical protein [Humibacillus sp. DSM 29435]|uniref:hypothetical protein n=1 Tax=Humibacillus sp. DSM 29435 TaxID=1869167 RepID=UPI001113199E|nr:hypothetical protein [Humibacillus sp. DSM 29435]
MRSQVLWANEDAVEAQWGSGLREILTTGAAPLPPQVQVEPSHDAGPNTPQAVSEEFDPRPQQARLQRLREWASAESERTEVAALPPELLQIVAFQNINSADDVLARCAGLTIPMDIRLARELAAVVSERPAPEQLPEKPKPVAGSEWSESPGVFAGVDWSTFGEGQARPLTPLLTHAVEGGISLDWQDPADLGRVRIFRVVASADTWPALDPSQAEPVGVTLSTSVAAPLVATSAVTFIGVWCHAGQDEVAARMAAPVFVAQGQVVWPPSRLTLQVTPRKTVAATFNVPPGATIQVQRFGAGSKPRFNQAAALDPSVLVGNGFVDPHPPVGEVSYAVYASVRLGDGSLEWSEPVMGTVTVRVRPTSLPLTVSPNGVSPGTYDISWETPEHGAVEVFLSPSAPPAGLSEESRTREIVRSQGLTPDRLLPYPTLSLGDTTVIQGVAIPDEWARAYFVATHVMAEDAVGVGPTVGLVLPRPPRNPELIERVDTQIITFAWPAADAQSKDADVIVEVHQGPRQSQELDVGRSQPIVSMTHEQYVLMGGIHLTRTLPPNGCSLHLFGVIYERGRPRRSHGVALDYPGITRVAYDIVAVRQDGQRSVNADDLAGYAVTVLSNEVLDAAHFVVVHHPQRLPLSPNDPGARELLSELRPLIANVTQTLGHLTPGTHMGFVRLFYSPPDRRDCARIAVIDPDPANLWRGVC